MVNSWQRVEVKLVRGNLVEQLRYLAARHHRQARREARQAILESARAQWRDMTVAIQDTRERLAEEIDLARSIPV
jgi:hypothetical protein